MDSIEQNLIDPIDNIEVVWLTPKFTLNVGDELLNNTENNQT